MIADERSGAEHELAARVIDTLLREDCGSLSRRLRLRDGRQVLDLPADQGATGRTLPLERDGFLADYRIRRRPAGSCLSLRLDDVDSALRAVSDPLDSGGVTAFTAECREALAAIRLRDRHQAGVSGRLTPLWRAAPDALSGSSGMLAYEALAAAMPHPAYPTSEARRGFSEDDSLRYAPEYRPEFALRWVAVPRSRLTTVGRHDHRPPGWPTASEVGLPESLSATHDLLPVHPVTARHELGRALAGGELAGAVIAPGPCLRVTPTLSTRTVAVRSQPRSHIKLPLPTSTLGLLNRRSIKPGTLADGTLVGGILSAAVQGDSQLGGLLLAEEEAVEGLSVIVRDGLRGCLAPGVTPILAAALTEPADPSGGETAGGLLDERAPEWLLGWWEAYVQRVAPPVLHALFEHGIVLEPHLQNVLIGVDADGLPVQAIFRDLEGVKLLTPRHDALLTGLKPGVARALAYDLERGWNRVAYCLLVNHLAEIAAAMLGPRR